MSLDQEIHEKGNLLSSNLHTVFFKDMLIHAKCMHCRVAEIIEILELHCSLFVPLCVCVCQVVVKNASFMIEIILSVFSIPLYTIIKRGKLKKKKNEKMRFQLGGGSLTKSQLLLLVKNKISMYVMSIMCKRTGLAPRFQPSKHN